MGGFSLTLALYLCVFVCVFVYTVYTCKHAGCGDAGAKFVRVYFCMSMYVNIVVYIHSVCEQYI